MQTINLDTAPNATSAMTRVMVGDVLVFHGRPHAVDALEPYTPPAAWGISSETRIARAADGWGITVFGWVGRQT